MTGAISQIGARPSHFAGGAQGTVGLHRFGGGAGTVGRPSPAIRITTPRFEVPQAQAVTHDVMQAPQREAVINHAGAAFWASQAIREDERREDKSGFEPKDEIDTQG